MPELDDDKLTEIIHGYSNIQQALFSLSMLIGVGTNMDDLSEEFITDFLRIAGEVVQGAMLLRDSVVGSVEASQ